MATATVLHSFSELARVFKGDKVKAKKVVELATYTNVEDKCGRKAAVIWAFLQDAEATKKYGPQGWIIHDPQTIAEATGYELDKVIDACISLVTHKFARLAANGQQIKAM